MKNMIKFFTTTLMIIAAIMVANPIVSYAAPQEVEPGVWFDAEYYAANNPDVVAVFGTDPGMLYLHYKTYGKNEGRLPMAPTTNNTNTTININGIDIPSEYDSCDGSPCVAVIPNKYGYGYGYYGNFEMQVESYVIQMVNEERTKIGIQPLIVSDELMTFSHIRATELPYKYDHIRPDGSRIPRNYAEVLTLTCVGNNAYEVATNIILSYKSSPAHWAALMDSKYNYIGIGEYTVVHPRLSNIKDDFYNYNIMNICK